MNRRVAFAYTPWSAWLTVYVDGRPTVVAVQRFTSTRDLVTPLCVDLCRELARRLR